jgi:hypothetical protein
LAITLSLSLILRLSLSSLLQHIPRGCMLFPLRNLFLYVLKHILWVHTLSPFYRIFLSSLLQHIPRVCVFSPLYWSSFFFIDHHVFSPFCWSFLSLSRWSFFS